MKCWWQSNCCCRSREPVLLHGGSRAGAAICHCRRGRHDDFGWRERCTDARLAFCGVGDNPIDASSAAEVLVGSAPTRRSSDPRCRSVRAENDRSRRQCSRHGGLSAPHRRPCSPSARCGRPTSGCAMDSDFHDITLSVNGKPISAPRRIAPAAERLYSPRSGAGRHPCRLRARPSAAPARCCSTGNPYARA